MDKDNIMSIANSGHDENGRYHGGKAGDQTGTEWEIRSWYNRPWDFVARFDSEIGQDIAKLAKNAANNEKIGYDQDQRTTFWQQLQKTKDYDPANIKIACEADCSAGVAAIVKAVGYRKGLQKLKDVPVSMWTGNERSVMKNAGAIILTDKKFLTSDAYLLPGDILCNESHHTAINITTGSKVGANQDAIRGTRYEVIVDALNIRNMASTIKDGSKVMGTLSKGDIVYLSNVKINKKGNTWGKIASGTYKNCYIAIEFKGSIYAKKG